MLTSDETGHRSVDILLSKIIHFLHDALQSRLGKGVGMDILITDTAEMKRRFLQEVPAGVRYELAQTVVSSYRRASTDCEAWFGPEEKQYLEPHYRRVVIERDVSKLAGLFPGTVGVAKPLNAAGNLHYAAVQLDDWAITISKVRKLLHPIRSALFRQQLASISQLALFDAGPPPVTTRTNMRLWAAIVHGPGEWKYPFPGFVHIVFPNGDGSYAPGLDLLDEFPDLIHDDERYPVETIARPPTPPLKPQVKKEEETGSTKESP